MKDQYFSISQLAESQGISRQTLIHYDRIGLFHPAHVNPDNGYREYSPSQLSMNPRREFSRDWSTQLKIAFTRTQKARKSLYVVGRWCSKSNPLPISRIFNIRPPLSLSPSIPHRSVLFSHYTTDSHNGQWKGKKGPPGFRPGVLLRLQQSGHMVGDTGIVTCQAAGRVARPGNAVSAPGQGGLCSAAGTRIVGHGCR